MALDALYGSQKIRELEIQSKASGGGEGGGLAQEWFQRLNNQENTGND